MTLKKQKDKLILHVTCILVYIVFRFLSFTYRKKIFLAKNRERAHSLHPSGSVLFGFWHEHTFGCLATHGHQNIAPMVSHSKDGEIVATICKKMGYETVRGSSNRGGKEAKGELEDLCTSGIHGAFAVDGPKGPRHKLKSGIVALSRDKQIPIIPVTVLADRNWILTKTWDQTRIPKPFSKLACVYGEPIIVPSNAHSEKFNQIRDEIGQRIIETEKIAQQLLAEKWN